MNRPRFDESSPRSVALQTLLEAEKPDSPPLDELIHKKLSDKRLAPPDARLYYQIVQGTTRHRLLLDDVVGRFARTPLQAIPLPLRRALSLGAFQYLFLDRIPVHAIVNETVELVASLGFPRRSCGFVNALLRKITQLDRNEALSLPENPGRNDILLRYSLPDWIGREIEAVYGPDSLRTEAEALTQPAGLDLRINTLKGTPESTRAALESSLQKTEPPQSSSPNRIRIDSGRYCPDALRLSGSLDVTTLTPFVEGLATVQDEAAQLISYWLNVRPGMKIADFCSAPGGKTAHLAARMNNDGEIWALDADPARLLLVEETARRLGCTCVRTALNTRQIRRQWKAGGARVGAISQTDLENTGSDQKNDAQIARGTASGAFLSTGPLDAALVDPPCTSLGTLRRHPDVKWRKTPSDCKRLGEIQLEILSRAANCIRPGGALVYSVCTFTRAETLEVIEKFLAAHSEWFRDPNPSLPSLIPDYWRTPSGDWLIQTGRDGIDGFFVSRLLRQPAAH